MSDKQLVLQALNRLPEEITFGDIAAEVAFLAAVKEGQDDAEAGRIVSNEEMKQRLDGWFAK